MGTGDDRATTKARLRLLRQELTTTPGAPREPGRRAPEGRPPVDVAIIDYLVEARREVVAHTRAVAPTAGPVPADETAVYDWAYQHTGQAPAQQRLILDAMVIRHGLKHALEAGDESVIRQEPCPGCNCWSLFWMRETRRAVCWNRNCPAAHGPRRSEWTLTQVAEHRAMAQNARSVAAT